MAKKPAADAPKNKWYDELKAIYDAYERIRAEKLVDAPYNKQLAKQTKWEELSESQREELRRLDDELYEAALVYERHLQAEREKRSSPADARPSKITNVMIDDHVLVDPKLGIDSKMAHPTQDACVKAWEAKHGSAARERVRDRYNTHAKAREIPVKPGPRTKSAK